jgi:tyrosyl-tRNA synthetase
MQLLFTYDDCFSDTVADSVGVAEARKRAEAGEILHIKLGIDPTSADIHIGRSTIVWRLRAFQEMGHHIEIIIGDFTGQVGDTSDKDSERPMLSEETVRDFMKEYEKQLWMVLNPEKRDQVTFSHNSTWLAPLTFGQISHLADAFSVNQFTKRELVAKRLESGSRVSLREMLYPVMQGYDSIAVKADVELGGTDQWFNLLAGRALQEQAGMHQQAVIVGTLVPGLDGRKMSSSYGNGIFLLDTPANKFGKMMSMRDDVMVHILPIFPRSARPFTADELETRMAAGENPRDLKMALAERLVELYHGADVAAETRQAYISQFSEGKLPDDMPEVTVTKAPILDVLVANGLSVSRSEARLLIQQGGVRFNGEVVPAIDTEIDAQSGDILQVGKRRFIKFV